jgi:histidine triad (HIT) family protein
MLSDLPKELVGPLFTNAQLLVKAVKIGLQAEGTFLAINNKVSQSVPHLHIHIIPRKYGDGLRGFFWPRQSYQSEEQMNEITNSIRTAIEKIQNGTVS